MIESVTQKISKKWHTIGIEEGIEKGREKGIAEAVKNIAINHIRIGTDDAIIIQVTGLSPEELDRIKAEL